MQETHQYLATVPFDIYELHLLNLVAAHGSFTKAAAAAGLTQSAITRQVQGVESRLGLALFERTTRQVVATDAGTFLLKEGARLIGDVDSVLQQLRARFTDGAKEVRLGVSKTISFSHLPGIVAAQRKRCPDVGLRVMHESSEVLLSKLDGNAIDVAVLCPPRRLPPSLRVVHRFSDAFELIVSPDLLPPSPSPDKKSARWDEWLRGQSWLLIHEGSETGGRLRSWMKRRGWLGATVTELDSFDLIVNLVSLGQGISIVPQRTLALYARRRRVQRFAMRERFTRELVVLARRNPKPPAHVLEFVENVLF